MSSVLVPFLPLGVVTQLAEEARTSEPRKQRLEGAFLRVELTNLIRWVETHCLSGNLGPGAITQLLDRSLSPLLHTLLDFGGDVLQLHEQSLVAFWPVVPEERPLKDAVIQALHAGQLLLQQAQGNERLSGTSLSLRVAVTSGVTELWHLRGLEEQRRLLLTGAPLLELAQCIGRVQPHELQLTASGRALVGEWVQGHPTVEGGLSVTAIRLTVPARRYGTLPPMLLTPEQLLPYVSPLVKRELPRGPFPQPGQRQRMTVLALTIPVHPHPLEATGSEAMLRQLEQQLLSSGGLLHRIWQDGSQLHALVLFGLASERGENPTLEALQLAQQLQRKPTGVQGATQVAVVVGTLFCGAFGSRRRAEYMALGEALTTAQRLARQSLTGVVCDFNAFQAGRMRFSFTPLPPRAGLDAQPEEPSFVMGETPVHASTEDPPVPSTLTPLWQALEEHAQARTGGYWLVKSEEGLGLDQLLRQLRRDALRLGVRTLWGMGELTRRTSPLAALAWPLRQLLGLEQALSREEARQLAYEQLQSSPQVREQASRLNAVLPLDLEGLDPLRLTGQLRQLEVFDMLELLIREALERQPILLVLEEVQHLDSASWSLLYRLAGELPGCMVVLSATLPLLELTPASVQVLNQPWLKQLSVERLTPRACEQQLEQVLIPALQVPGLADKLFFQTEGHPYLVQHWLKLVQQGQQVEGPLQLHHVLQRRLGGVSPLQALVLQTAAVIGCVFSYRLLVAILPLRQVLEHLPQLLESLKSLGIERLDAPEPELLYHFRLPTLQHLAYHQLSFTQRMALHESIARWYSAQLIEDRSSLFGLEAHHWERSLNAERASGSLRRAGEHALAHGSADEAIELFEQTLAQERLLARPMERLDRARSLRQLGQALLLTGRLEEGLTRLEEALSELEEAPSSSLWPRSLWMIGQFLALFFAVHTLPHPNERVTPRPWNPFQAPMPTLPDPSALPSLAQDERIKLLTELLRLSFMGLHSMNNLRLLLKLLYQSRQHPRSATRAQAYALVGILMLHIKNSAKALEWQALALDQLGQEEASVEAAHAYRVLAINRLLLTEWAQAQHYIQQAELMSRQLRDGIGLLDALGLRAWLHLLRGEPQALSELGQQTFQEARRMGQLHGQHVGLYSQIYAAIWQGANAEALLLWEQLNRLPKRSVYTSDQLTLTGLHAHLLMLQGHSQEACLQIEGLAPLVESLPMRIMNVQAFMGCVHIFSILLQLMEASKVRKLRSRLARRIFSKLRTIILLSGEKTPAFAPISSLFEGRLLRLYGPSLRARRMLTRGQALARRADMRMAEHLCMMELELLMNPGQHPRDVAAQPVLANTQDNSHPFGRKP